MRSLFLVAFLLSGCIGSECDTRGDLERVERIGSLEVHESLRITSCFMDPVFERVITVHDASGDVLDVGRYSDEARSGLTRVALVQNTLAIFSGAHVYLVDVSSIEHLREATVRPFSPYDSPDFTTEYAHINGHYDLEGTAFFIDGTTWVLRYESPSNPDGVREGEPIEFISRDRGATFRVRAR